MQTTAGLCRLDRAGAAADGVEPGDWAWRNRDFISRPQNLSAGREGVRRSSRAAAQS